MKARCCALTISLVLSGLNAAQAQLNGGGPAGPWTPFSASLWSSAMADSGGPYQPHQYESIKFADVNGDGISDLCYRDVPSANTTTASGGIKCAIAGNGQFGPATTWTKGFNSLWSANPSNWQTIQYADVNGDGKADVCGRWADGIHCALSNGSSFGPATLWSPVFSDANGWNSDPSFWKTIRFIDVNGDGKADVCGRGYLGIYCALSDGTSFGQATLWSAQYGNPNNWQSDPSYWSTIQFADINGDGKMDVCGRAAAGMVCAVSNGQQFVNLAVWTTQFSDANGWNQPQYYSTIQFADIDGDRKADVCGRGSGGVYCGRSTGTSFGSDVFTLGASAFSDGNGWNAQEYYQTIRVVDVDGDGRADVCGRGYTAIWCQLSTSSHTQTRFAPLLEWVSDFGDNYGWGASPSYWGTVQPARLSIDPYTAQPVNGFCGRGYGGIVCTDTVHIEADAAYDWTPGAESTWEAAFSAWAAPQVLGTPPSGVHVVIPISSYQRLEDELGYTGSWDGVLYSNNGTPTRAYLSLKNYQGQVHGSLTVLEQNGEVDGGSCGQFPIPTGTIPVNLTSTGPVPQFGVYRSRFDATGSTTRQVSFLGIFSGELTTNINLSLLNKATSTMDSEIFGSIQINAPSPCQSEQLNLYFTRRNKTLYQAFGYL